MSKRYASVWDALIDDPGERESYKIKSKLMMSIEQHIKDKELTQDKAAELMGVSQPKISNIVNGKIDKITIDMLVKMLVKVGVQISFHVDKTQSTLPEEKAVTIEAKTKPSIYILSYDSTSPVEAEEIITQEAPFSNSLFLQSSDYRHRYPYEKTRQ